jgi:hypothetical protein
VAVLDALQVFGQRLAARLARWRLRCLGRLGQATLQLGQLRCKLASSSIMVSANSNRCAAVMASVFASNFQRRSRATSKLSLSILTCAQAISRSRRASSCA